MKLKGLLLMGLSVGVVGMTQLDVAHAESPWLNITDKSVPRTDFIDISSNNGIPSVQDFKIMKSYGVKGVVIKLTEGTVYRNPYAATQIANAKAAGQKWVLITIVGTKMKKKREFKVVILRNSLKN